MDRKADRNCAAILRERSITFFYFFRSLIVFSRRPFPFFSALNPFSFSSLFLPYCSVVIIPFPPLLLCRFQPFSLPCCSVQDQRLIFAVGKYFPSLCNFDETIPERITEPQISCYAIQPPSDEQECSSSSSSFSSSSSSSLSSDHSGGEDLTLSAGTVVGVSSVSTGEDKEKEELGVNSLAGGRVYQKTILNQKVSKTFFYYFHRMPQ